MTSRQQITLSWLKELPLDELPVEDAVNLSIEISPRCEDYAAQIAEKCGCLPLALRLAASALEMNPHLTPERYLERLNANLLHELDKAGGETEERPPVSASLTLSYDLLPDELKVLWRRLAVFRRGFLWKRSSLSPPEIRRPGGEGTGPGGGGGRRGCPGGPGTLQPGGDRPRIRTALPPA